MLGVGLVACALPLGVYAKGGVFNAAVFALSGLVLASYAMSRTSNLLAQIVARAVWWQSLVFGGLMGGSLFLDVLRDLEHGMVHMGPNRHLIPTSIMYVLGSSAALFGAGRVGLDYESSRFFPVEFRRSMMASLVMAIADTIALSFYAGLELTEYVYMYGSLANVATFVVGAVVMGVAVWGLYRLRVWGLMLNTIANVVIAGLAMFGVFDLPGFLSVGLAATAVAQVVLLMPLLGRVFGRS